MTEPELLHKGGCRWQTTYEHAFQTGSLRKPDKQLVKCCHCKQAVPYIESYVTVPYGAHGNRLPLPVFLHCQPCADTLDAYRAYMVAFQKDINASLPDPEKVKREAELNEQMAQIPGLENRI